MARSLRMTAMRWSGGGAPARATTLPPHLVALLDNALGVRPPERPTVALDEMSLPPPTFDVGELRAITEITTATKARIQHTRGKSTVDLLRIRAGDVSDAPDAVVLPGSHEEVLDVLRWCTERRVAGVPLGGRAPGGGGPGPPPPRFPPARPP